MVNYLGKFIPNLTEQTTPLDNLLRKRCCVWITKASIRPHWKFENHSNISTFFKDFWFKITNSFKNWCQFSRTRCFSQTKLWNHRATKKSHPTGHSSQALQDYENRHTQIEKETLQIVLGAECFHEYLYGHRFIINDHKPFKSIFNRSLISCPPCIQKFFLCLQKYNFKLQYSPGKDMLVSGTLSISHLSHSEPEFTENNLIHHVHFALWNLLITSLKQFQLETRNDPILQTLITYTTHGWTEKHLILTDLLLYYTHQSDVTLCGGILLKSERIIVLTTLQAEMNSLIPQGHLGVEKSKNVLGNHYFGH